MLSKSKILLAMLYMAILWFIMAGITEIPGWIRDMVDFGSVNYLNIIIFSFVSVIWGIYLIKSDKGIKKGLKSINAFFIIFSFALFLFLEAIDAFYSGAGSKTVISLILNFFMLCILCSFTLFYFDTIDESLKFIIKPYIHITLYIATTGVLCYLLTMVNILDTNDWMSINEKMKKAYEGQGGTLLYSMPLYLTFMLVGSDIFSLFGFNIIRISGLSYEPHIAALFTVPSLFMINYYFRDNASAKRWSYLIIVTYLLFVASVTSIVCLMLVLLLYSFKEYKVSVKRIFLIAIILLAVTQIPQLFYADQVEQVTKIKPLLGKIDAYKTIMGWLLDPIINSHDLIGYGMFALREVPTDIVNGNRGMIGLLYFYIFLMILAIIAIRYFFKSIPLSRDFGIFSLTIVYYILHSFKSQQLVFYFTFASYIVIAFSFWVLYRDNIRPLKAL